MQGYVHSDVVYIYTYMNFDAYCQFHISVILFNPFPYLVEVWHILGIHCIWSSVTMQTVGLMPLFSLWTAGQKLIIQFDVRFGVRQEGVLGERK